MDDDETQQEGAGMRGEELPDEPAPADDEQQPDIGGDGVTDPTTQADG